MENILSRESNSITGKLILQYRICVFCDRNISDENLYPIIYENITDISVVCCDCIELSRHKYDEDIVLDLLELGLLDQTIIIEDNYSPTLPQYPLFPLEWGLSSYKSVLKRYRWQYVQNEAKLWHRLKDIREYYKKFKESIRH